MTNDEYSRLTEFIGRKFDEVDSRFEQVDRRFEQVAAKEEVRAQQEETRRHMGVLVEAVRDDVRQLAEGLAETNQRLDRLERKVEEGFAETRAAIRFSYAQLEQRLQELEGNYASLNERVTRLESRER